MMRAYIIVCLLLATPIIAKKKRHLRSIKNAPTLPTDYKNNYELNYTVYNYSDSNETFLSQNYYYSYIYTDYASSREYDNDTEYEPDIMDEYTKETWLALDLQGNLMKQFFIEAALLNPYRSVVCSPLAAMLSLGKLAFGADGYTLDELLRAVGHFKFSTLEQVQTVFQEIIQDLHHLRGANFSLASKLYLNDRNDVNKNFQETITHIFGTGVELLNLIEPFVAVAKINTWVKHKTDGMIEHMLKPDDADYTMDLIIVNAVYFKAGWTHAFKEVKPAIFYGLEGETNVSMMKAHNYFEYAESKALDAQLIKIPFQGVGASLVVVLPSTRLGLFKLLDELRYSPRILNRIRTKRTRVDLYLPAFTIQSDIDLSVLYEMTGLTEIFSKDSGFKNIIERGSVKVDAAYQRVIIELRPEGYIGHSVAHGIPVSQAIFEAHHPFLYFVVTEPKERLLLSGTFTSV